MTAEFYLLSFVTFIAPLVLVFMVDRRKPLTNTRETLIFSCIMSHQWASLRFTDSFHPQEPNCPVCGKMWTNVVQEVLP